MIEIIKPEKSTGAINNVVAPKMQRRYLDIVSDNVNVISLTFKLFGYGVKLSGYHLLWTTLIAAYWFVVLIDNTVGFNTTNGFMMLIESVVGGFISLVLLSLIMGILNAIFSIPSYIMIRK
jgi:hypothetical protein